MRSGGVGAEGVVGGTAAFVRQWAPTLERSERLAFVLDLPLGVARWANAVGRARVGEGARLEELFPHPEQRAALRDTIAARRGWAGALADGTSVFAVPVLGEGNAVVGVFVEGVGPVVDSLAALNERLAAAEAELRRLRRAARWRDAEHAVAMAVGRGLPLADTARLALDGIDALVAIRGAVVTELVGDALAPVVSLRAAAAAAAGPLATSPAAAATRRRAPVQRVVAEAVREHPALRPLADAGVPVVLHAPIHAGEAVLGFLEVHGERAFLPEEVELVSVLAGLLGIALVRERAAAEQRRKAEAHALQAALAGGGMDADEKLVHAARLASVGELAAGLVHELNQPLNVLGGYVELFREGALGPAAQARALDVMGRAVVRMTRLVDDLRTFTRGGGPEFAVVELAGVVRMAHDLTVGALKRAVTLDVAPGLAVLGDESRLEQVVVNLLANALQSSGDPITVRVYADAAGQAVLQVEDRGPGVPAELRARIFEPFFTTKPAGQGTGLGLSVSARIVSDHGGKLEVADNPGGGAVFRMTLPAWRPDDGTAS